MPSETPESAVSLEQFRDLLDMLRRTIQGASDLASRVEVTERAASGTVDVLTSLQKNQERMLDAFQAQSQAQNKLNADLARAVEDLVARVEYLEGKRRVM